VVVQNSTRDKLQGKDFAINDERMPSIMSTLVAHHMGTLLSNDIDDSALAFIAPLSTDHY
jgi:hypothetical protein